MTPKRYEEMASELLERIGYNENKLLKYDECVSVISNILQQVREETIEDCARIADNFLGMKTELATRISEAIRSSKEGEK